jgi:hypothetical protein
MRHVDAEGNTPHFLRDGTLAEYNTNNRKPLINANVR